jgi:hypothetical protein
MTITKYIHGVSAKNLKGPAFHYALSPKTIIFGANFSGKTRIADAVRLALLANLPELGLKNSATFELSSGSEMSVTLDLTGCEVERIQRTWRTERGSIKASHNLTAEEDAYRCPLLNVAEWFGMTERERIDFVFRSVRMPEDKTAAGIIATLQRLTFGDEHSEAIEEAKADIITSIKYVMTRGNGPGSFDPAKLPDAIMTAESELAEDFKLWNGRAKDGEGAIRIMTELKLQADECSAVTLTDLRNEQSRLEGLSAEANRVMGALTSQQEAAVATVRRRGEIEHLLTKVPPAAKPEPTFRPTVDIETMRSALRHGEEGLKQYPVEDEETPRNDAFNLRLVREGLEGRLKNIAGTVDKLRGDLLDLDALECCPNCQSKGKGWKKHLQASIEKQLEAECGMETQLGVEKAAAAQREELAFGTFKQIESRQAARREIERNISLCRDKIQQHERDVAAFERDLERVRHDNATDASAFSNQIDALRAELARLQEVPAPTESELTAARLELDGLQQKLVDIGNRIRTAEQLSTRLRDATASAEIATKAAARRDVIKKIKTIITEIKGRTGGGRVRKPPGDGQSHRGQPAAVATRLPGGHRRGGALECERVRHAQDVLGQRTGGRLRRHQRRAF